MKKPNSEKVSLRMEMIWANAENRIIQDIVRRIHKESKITSTADYQINRLVKLGKSTEEIERILKETLNATYPEMYELYDEVSNWQYVRNKDIYEQVNGEFIPPEDNEWLIEISEAVKQQTKDELVNLSQSYGFSVMMGNKRVFMPFAQYYQKYVDNAIMDIISGGYDYNTVIRRVVTQMTNSGLRSVNYASGHSNRTPVAVRRAILTGVAQITGKVAERNAKLLGTNYYEVDWHSAARPTHRVWQGKVYSYQELVDICGLGTVTGLHGANCSHDYHPFVPGVSERLYPDEWLEEQNEKEARTKTWDGKEYDAYGLTQKQRRMETAMRAQREKVDALKAAKVDPDEIMIARAKYQAQLNEYSQFCKKMGLKEQRERIYYDMRGRVATNTKKQNAKYTPEMLKNADKDSKEFDKYKNILGNDIGTLAEFRQMKYTNSSRYELLKNYSKSIEKGMISRLSGFENYVKIHDDIEKNVIGLRTSNGIEITGQSKHLMERVIGTTEDPKTQKPRSGVSVKAIADALVNPLDVKKVIVGRDGKRSQKFIGENATITINPDDGILVQCNPTDSDLVRRLKNEKI